MPPAEGPSLPPWLKLTSSSPRRPFTYFISFKVLILFLCVSAVFVPDERVNSPRGSARLCSCCVLGQSLARHGSWCFGNKWMCLKCPCVSFLERSVRPPWGPWPSFLWPSSVIQSRQLADRGEGVSQGACFPEASSSLPHLGSSKGRRMRAFLEALVAWPLEGGNDLGPMLSH